MVFMPNHVIQPAPSAASAASTAGGNAVGRTFIALAVATVAAILAFDKFGLGLSLLRESDAPDLSTSGLWHAVAWAAFATFLAIAIAARAQALPAGMYGRFDLVPRDAPVQRIVWTLLIVGIAMLPLVLIVLPHKFTAWAREDHWVEWTTVALLLMGMAVCIPAALRRRDAGSSLQMALVLLLGFVLFLVAGEEVSWLQRVLKVKTPDAFAGNDQHEMNFHNFATGASENAYYFCAGFVLLAVAPLWRALRLPAGPLARVIALTPRPYLIGVAALIAAHNYDMWDGAFMQLAFWGSVGILAGLTWARRASSRHLQPALLLIGMVVLQVLYLSNGHRSARPWDVTEYRELLIAAGLFLYTVDLWRAPSADA